MLLKNALFFEQIIHFRILVSDFEQLLYKTLDMGRFLLWLSYFIYYQLGKWKVFPKIPDGLRKGIIIVAPHTSKHDFPVGLGCDYKMNVNAGFLGKKELFDGPFGFIFRATGGMPVDRSKSTNLVDQVADIFANHEDLFLVIAPEGTRKLTKRWKTGFYHMAKAANVPIIMAYIDFGKKECGLGQVLYPTDNMQKDFAVIEAFYRTKKPRFPENFNPKLIEDSDADLK
jgi:1-acyl-sn-glycerol-3-phosphate acyltransferase